MAAKISGFKELERDNLTKALHKADWEIKSICKDLDDLANLPPGSFPDARGQRILKALKVVFGLEVSFLGVGPNRQSVGTITSTLRDVRHVLNDSDTVFRRESDPAGDWWARAIDPLPFTSFLALNEHGTRVIEVNAPLFFHGLYGRPKKEEDQQYKPNEWRYHAYLNEPAFTQATILVHEAVHHLHGGAASGEESHYCDVGGSVARDAYRYQIFMVAYRMEMFPFSTELDPKEFGPPPQSACTKGNQAGDPSQAYSHVHGDDHHHSVLGASKRVGPGAPH